MKTGRHVAWAMAIAIGAALVGGADDARADDAPAGRTVVATPTMPLSAAGGFDAAWSAAVESALATVRGLSTVQRFVVQRIAPTAPAPPPIAAATPAPPTEKGGPPRVGPVTLRPVAIDRTALTAIEPRPFEAVLLGAVVPLPWDVP